MWPRPGTFAGIFKRLLILRDMGYKHLNKPPFSGAGSSEYTYGSYRSGHRRSSVPNRAGSCGCLYYRGCKASLLFISSAVYSTLANKCKNTKNSGVILRILILEYWLSIPHWLAQGFCCLLTKDVQCPYHMVWWRAVSQKCIMIHSCSRCPWELGSLPYLE